MARVSLRVTNADNEIVVFLNGLVVYAREQEEDVTFDDVTDLDPYLTSGLNILILVGVNWSAAANYRGALTIGDITQPFSYQKDDAQPGVSWIQTFTIPA